MSWRLLVDDGCDAAGGLAADEALAIRAGAGDSPPTLRLYTYRPHCVLVGRFQDPGAEVDRDACEALGCEINRRPTGGGAILMGPDQLGVALAVPRRDEGLRAREQMQRFSRAIVAALDDLGIAAEFRGKNDLAVDGRKIAGLGVHRAASGGLLFHASLLVDLDFSLMTRVLRTPFGDDTDAVRQRIATVREHADVTTGDVRELLATRFGADAGTLTDEERTAITALAEKYRGADWIEQDSAIADASGEATTATPGGAIHVRLTLAGTTIKAVWIRGDFFAEARAIADVEARLRWCSTDTVRQTVRECWPDGATVDAEQLSRAVLAAVPTPYGCFVNPHA